jgi:putative methyltransferase (TIGR01177 family)
MLERTRLKVRGSYSVRKLGKSDIPEGIVADIVYRRLSNPRVDLKNPDTKLVYAEAAGSMYLGKLVWENDRRYLGRAPHLRPVLSPVSLPPKLARACVNLLGIRKGTVLDPFCGTGGILIEAALLGHRAVGYDIDPKMLLASKKNLDACNITGYSLFRRDALDLDQRHRYIVTDLPYGKNTGHLGNRLYPDFLKRLKKSNVRMAVVMFPASAEPARLLKKAGLSPAGVFSHYVHRSMTKEIVLIGNPWG